MDNERFTMGRIDITDEDSIAMTSFVPQLSEMYSHIGEISLGMEIKIGISKWCVHVDVEWKDYHVSEKIKNGDVIAAISGAINKLHLLWKQGT